MAVKIRLSRAGSKKRPFYRIVAADERAPRDGKFIEKLGVHNPMLEKDNDQRVVLDIERVKYWLGTGAKPTERVGKLLGQAGVIEMPKYIESPKKSAPKAKAQERARLAQEAEEAAKAEAKAAAEAAANAPEEKAEDTPSSEASA